MEYVISIFILGMVVTALVGKGIFMAQELAKEELKRIHGENGDEKIPP